jgi:hypothetical protein
MKLFGILGLALVLAACNATEQNTVQQNGLLKTGIEGTVTLGPTCPVQRVDDPSCDDRPYSAEIHVNTNNGVWVTQFKADAQGKFKVELEPGTYTLDPQTPMDNILPRANSQDVTVVSGAFTIVNIQYDSGIR